MTCGIYKLEFDSGHFYIGKSVNVEERWRQHFTKFVTGTAAKAMQQAFNLHGYPETTILLRCHEDHLDILEPVFIEYNYNSAYCLNSDRPKVYHDNPPTSFDGDMQELLKLSTFTHIEEILRLRQEKVEQLLIHNETLENKRKEYDINLQYMFKLPGMMEAIEKQDTHNLQVQHIRRLELEAKEDHIEIDRLRDVLRTEKQKNWWTKLWE